MIPKIVICVAATFYVFLTVASGQDDDTYPTYFTNKAVATNLHCKLNDSRLFRYVETTDYGGKPNYIVEVKADVTLHCLGDDKDGKYGKTGIKYLAIISEMKMGGNNSYDGTTGKQAPENLTSIEEGLDQDIGSEDWKQFYSVPFQFVQLADGLIPEIRFSDQEVNNTRVKNFKRHLVDAFATFLLLEQNGTIVETSVIGEHMSSYNITVNESSEMSAQSNNKSDTTVTVEKRVTKDDIRKLPITKAMNNLENMAMLLEQKQVYKNGNIISSIGSSFLDATRPQNNEKSNYNKNEANSSNSLPVFSSYELHVVDDVGNSSGNGTSYFEQWEHMSFDSASRMGEEDDEFYWQKLWELYNAAGDITKMIEKLIESQAEDYEKDVHMLSKIVIREIYLKADEEPKSGCAIIRKMVDKKTLETRCSKNKTECEDFSRLLANAGGEAAEAVFISLLNEKTSLSLPQQHMITDALSYFSRPSAQFLDSLIKLRSKEGLDKDMKSTVILAIGSLASEMEVGEKDKIAKDFVNTLTKLKNDCKTNDFFFLLDTLEAIGNFGYEKTVSSVLEVAKNCEENFAIQIACVHAIRHQINSSPVELWLKNKIIECNNCFVVEGIVAELLQSVEDQMTLGDTYNWPRNGFNKIDESLKQLLDDSPCSMKNIILYFSRKRCEIANAIAQNYFDSETESWTSLSNKYSLLISNVTDPDDIQIPNNKTFINIKKSIGPEYLNLDGELGMYAGYNWTLNQTLPTFQFLAKAVSNVNAFGSKLNIATLFAYVEDKYFRTYIRVFGHTLYEKDFDLCFEFEVSKTKSKSFPIISFPIGIYNFNLELYLEGTIYFFVNCSEKFVFDFGPDVRLKVGGEASASGIVTRVGINVETGLNYKQEYNFKPFHYICISGKHGHDAIRIEIKGFIQFWRPIKKIWGGKWEWSPDFLKFDVVKAKMTPLFDEACLLNKNSTSFESSCDDEDSQLQEVSFHSFVEV